MTNEANRLRNDLLQVIRDSAEGPAHSLQTNSVLGKFHSQFQNVEREQALLTLWQDLFRTGYLAWGYNLDNPNPPFFHLTEKGRRWLEHFSRDPVNPDGYFAYVAKQSNLNPVARSYLEEAVRAYNNDCIRSSVVMTGAAAESLALDLRDALVSKIRTLGQNVPKDLEDQRIKRVLEGLGKTIEAKKGTMAVNLREAFESHWSAFAHQIRQARNDAGHPKNIDSVSDETAHASLLIFPELAKLYSGLSTWILASYC
jgi:hypothetical protein